MTSSLVNSSDTIISCLNYLCMVYICLHVCVYYSGRMHVHVKTRGRVSISWWAISLVHPLDFLNFLKGSFLNLELTDEAALASSDLHRPVSTPSQAAFTAPPSLCMGAAFLTRVPTLTRQALYSLNRLPSLILAS